MKNTSHIFIFALLLIQNWQFSTVYGRKFKFTSLRCESYDKSKVIVKLCYIEPVSRFINTVSIYAIIKERIESANVHVKCFKRASGWKPFLIDFSVDACQFLKNAKQFALAAYFWNVVERYTNLNHSCPIDHDIFVHKFLITQATATLPLPTGEYLMNIFFNVNGKLWARLNSSIAVDES